MDAVSFGPLMLSTERLWLIVAVAVFFFRRRADAQKMAGCGVIIMVSANILVQSDFRTTGLCRTEPGKLPARLADYFVFLAARIQPYSRYDHGPDRYTLASESPA